MTAKRILILAERFYPEEFLINDLAATWQARGFEVEVLTQVPSYPHDRIYDGYRNRLLQTTREFHDIPVHRVRTVLGYNRGMKHKIVNYINFTFWTSLWALFNGWRYDRIFTFHSGPLSMAGAGLIFRFLWFRKCMIWTQDVWPDTVYSYGVKPTLAMRLFLNSVVRTIYLAYAEISVSCPGFVERLKPYTGKKVRYFPQWTSHAEALPAKPRGGKLTFTFAGNIGSVQNLELVARAFGELRRTDAELVILGSGIYLERLRRLVTENDYQNIVLPGRKPQAEMPKYFAQADVLIISLKPEFDLTVPAKFQAYIASGRPVLGLVRGDTAALIAKHDLGMTADPADEAAIRSIFVAMCDSPAENFARWRENALALSQKEFNRETIIEEMTAVLIQMKESVADRILSWVHGSRLLINYCLIGVTGASLDFLLFLFLTEYLGLYYQYANCISVSLGIFNNFILNSWLNFKITDRWFCRLLSFYGVGIFGLGLSSVLLFVMVENGQLNKYLAKFLVIGIVTVVQFSMNKYITFKSKRSV